MRDAKLFVSAFRFPAFRFYFRRFSFFNQPHGRRMQAAQFRFAGLVFGEFHEVAALQKFTEFFLLFRRQQIRALQLAQKFLGRAFRRAEIKPLFQIDADGVGDQNAERLWLRDQRERLRQLSLRAHVRRHGRHNRNLRIPLPPPSPGENNNDRQTASAAVSTKAIPSRSEFPPAA